ncbi:MAG: ABC transporter ATP-binding protein [Parachlamydiaceae bacterium]|nr:ABC transporter ATP-binding protein [Parachlamydiaceae bacterium]
MILKLFFTAFRTRKHRLLLALTLVSMCLLTFASQLEILAIGVITKRGPDAFELFGPIKEGKLAVADSISKTDLDQRWNAIDSENKGYITSSETNKYLSKWQKSNLLDRVQQGWNTILPISDNLTNLALFIVFVALFKALTLFIQRYTTRLIAIRVSRDLRQKYFEHIQSLPMSFYQKYHIGSLASRVVGDASMVAEAINATLVNYIQTPFMVITTLTLCFMTSWELASLVFFGFPFIIFPIVFIAKRVKRISKQIQTTQESFASALIDFVAGIQTVKVFAMEDFSLRKYKERNQKMADLEQKSARYDLASRPIVHTISMSFLASAILYGLYVLQMGVSDVLVFCGLLYIFYEPIKKFAEENSHIQRGIAAAERMQEVMDIKPQIEDNPNAIPLIQFNDSIEFNNVWFGYDANNWILKDVSFTIKKGQTVAIVGPTGAGKSTIVQLLPRLYDVQKGTISIDGKPIHMYSQRSLREMIAFVPQRPFLFLDTITQNIAFGRPFTPSQVQAAAKKSHAEEFILRLPQGYATELDEGGKNLSGGQQQRLAIARALVKEAPVLIMDEATSSLDNVSEHHIKAAIQQLHGQVTQIIIAHRLSTIESADKIIFLDKGKKIAEGTKDELLVSCPAFKHMWELGRTASD